jgi:uncharacterized ferritin-like protein (DUF455 family)
MIAAFRRRYLDLLASIYIYNEHRGYTSIDRVLEAVRARAPDDHALIKAIEVHRADERKHYVMFKRWFELQGKMPLKVDRTCGHIDRFVEIIFNVTIDNLDTQAIIDNDDEFEKLCRVISLTEQRGFKQVEVLLKHPLVKHDKVMMKIFQVVHRDEPSHWAPYDGWLKANGKRDPKWWERAIDTFIHSELLFLKLPLLFVNVWMPRRTDWADAHDPAERLASPVAAAA